MFSFQSLLSKIQGASTIDFGDLFNESVTLFKKVWVQGLILQLFSILIMLPFIIILYVPYFELILENSSNGVVNSAALGQEFFRIVKHIDHGQAFVFSDLFYFFKAASIAKALRLAVTYLFISILAALLCFLPIIYAIVPLMFLLPVFAYNPDLSISEIVKVGFALGNKKWGITFLTLVLNGILLYVIALVTCGLGTLFVSCFIYLPQYIIYKNVIGFDGPKEGVQSID
jgi:hypothetical protein